MYYEAAVAFHPTDISFALTALMPNFSSCYDTLLSHTVWYRCTAAFGPSQLLATFFILTFYFFFYPCFALFSSSHLACAIQWYHTLPVTRRLHLLCPRAPPPSLLSLWQPRAVQSPPKMPTRREGIHGVVCGLQTALDVPSTAPWTAWTATRQWLWPWSQQQARDMHLWRPSRHVIRRC